MKIATLIALFVALSAALLTLTSLADDDGQDIMSWDGMPLKRSCDKNTFTINECAGAVWKAAEVELNSLGL